MKEYKYLKIQGHEYTITLDLEEKDIFYFSKTEDSYFYTRYYRNDKRYIVYHNDFGFDKINDNSLLRDSDGRHSTNIEIFLLRRDNKNV